MNTVRFLIGRCRRMCRGRPVVVLDLNGVLVRRARDDEDCAGMREPDLRVRRHRVWLRPGVQEMLDALQPRCDLAVWTSMQPQNATPIVDAVFGSRPLLFVFTQDQCEVEQEKGFYADKPEKALFAKRRERALEVLPELYFKRLLIVDNDPEKVARNPPECTVLVPEWDGARDCAELRAAIEAALDT